MDQDPSVDQILKINPQKPVEHRFSGIAIISLLLIFPPLAFYKIYKNKQYHSWVPGLLYTSGIFPLFVYFINVFYVAPQLKSLYAQFGQGQSVTGSNYSTITLFLLLFIQFIYGIYLRRKIKTPEIDSKPLLLIAFILMIISLVLSAQIFGNYLTNLITPLYQLTL